jgi:GT2 family glycosyltransferase
MNRVSLAVVIPARYPSPSLVACIASLTQQWPSDIAGEIVVVDDGSGADYSREIGNWLPPVRLERLAIQSGAGAARNLGVRTTTSKWIVFLDDDCTVPWNWTRSVIDFVAQEPHFSMTGAAIHSKRPGNWISQATEDFILKSKVTVDGSIRVVTACAVVNRDSFLQVGGFDTRFRGAGGEDWDLSHRMLRAGMTLSITDKFSCYHDNPTKPSAFFKRAWRYGSSSVLLNSEPVTTHAPDYRSKGKFLNPMYLSKTIRNLFAISTVDVSNIPFWRRQRGRVGHTAFLVIFRLARWTKKNSRG